MASIINWEDAFSNGAYITDAGRFMEFWNVTSTIFRKTQRCDLDHPYGDKPRQKFDVFLPSTAPVGVLIFIHGGYWIDFDKSSWSHFAAGPLAHNWAVVVPSYTLTPTARINEITQEITQAVTFVANRFPCPIAICGHSAGGQLATRMICDDTTLSANILARIKCVTSISGVHDLRPLLLHSMNAKLGLDEDEAKRESPALHRRIYEVPTTVWVGANERPEFLRQSALLSEAWRSNAAPVPLVTDPDRHHFNVIDGLCSPDHPLTRTVLGL